MPIYSKDDGVRNSIMDPNTKEWELDEEQDINLRRSPYQKEKILTLRQRTLVETTPNKRLWVTSLILGQTDIMWPPVGCTENNRASLFFFL